MEHDKKIDPRFEAVFQRGYNGAEPALHDGDGAPLIDTTEDEAPAMPGKSLARNPWIYVLWAFSAFALGVGVSASLWATSQFYGTGNISVQEYELVAVVQSLAPVAGSAGAFCLASALLVHAFNWMRKNP